MNDNMHRLRFAQILFISLFMIIPVGVWAQGGFQNVEILSDMGLPFRLTLNGKANSGRENFYAGFGGRYWVDDQTNLGLRFQTDIEKNSGLSRKMGVGFTFSEHWMKAEKFHPYFRMEVPWRFKDHQDVGIAGGGGIAWRLGQNPIHFFYDFGFHYWFGIKTASSSLQIDLFRIGLGGEIPYL